MVRTLLHVFPSFNTGGAQMRFVQLANHFGSRYRHRIIAMDGVTTAMERLNPDLDAALLSIDVRKGDILHNVRVFRRALKDMRPDLLVTSNWGSTEWAMANFGGLVPQLHMEDGFGPEERDRQLPRRVWTRRLVLRHAATLVPSRKLEAIARDIWKLNRKRLLYVPNGIDCARFAAPRNEAVASRFGIPLDAPIIGSIGGLRREKNPRRLIEAFALVHKEQPARLVIVGEGPELQALKDDAMRLGISDRVVFTGVCPTPEHLLPLFTVFALSSDTEQMPLSILEAMAASLPIASTDVGDVANMVAEANRPYVAYRDAGYLAGSIRALLSDDDKARQIGRTNRERAVAVYDQSAMFAIYERLFDGDLAPIAPR